MTTSTARRMRTVPRVAERGMIGRRTLTCVQLIDIGRLPGNPVYLRPGSFIAVTGVGPDDSNETSKTTFLAALTLLAGDHGWRFDSPGLGQYAAELLYNPPNSAAAAANRADHGYVVGVFVRPDGEQVLADGLADPLTLWLRIARDSPYLEARVVDGIRLASGERQAHYIATADRIWQELPRRDTIRSGKYVDALYGGLPLSTSYVSERGGMPQRHSSLLTSQLNDLTPAEIGDQLIDLGGLRPRFDQELAQRRTAAQLEARLKQRQAELTTEEQRVGDQLAVMQARQDALDQVERAIELRDGYVASAALEAIEARRRLQAEAAAIEHGDQAQRLRVELRQAQQELARLQDFRALEAAAEQARSALEEAKTTHDAKHDQLRTCELKLRETRERLAAIELNEAADRHTGRPLSSIDADLSAAQAKRDHAVGQAAVAKDGQHHAAAHLRTLMAGDGGPIVAALKAAGIHSAVAVYDAVEPAPDRQAFWDATLQPWRDAVAIDADDRRNAVHALHAHPGTLLVLGDRQDSQPLPAGVLAAPPVVRHLLASLAARTQPVDETGVLLDGHTIVVGGFAQPQVGRDARIAQARLALETAAGKLATATATLKGIDDILAMLGAEQQAANAHHQREQLRHEQADQVRTAERLRGELAPLAQARKDTEAAHRDAEIKLASHTMALQAATELANGKAELLRVEVEVPIHAKHAEAANQRLPHWVERLERLHRRPLVSSLPAGSALDDEPAASRAARLAMVDSLDVDANLLDLLAAKARVLVPDELVDARIDTLRRRYNERLDEALRTHLRIQVDEDRRGRRTVVAPGDVPEQIRAAVLRRANAADAGDDERVAAFDELAEALLDVYRPMVEADHVRKEQLTRRLDKLRTEVHEADDELDAARTQAGEMQGSLEELVRAFFERINQRFAEIVARDNGREADLLFKPEPPDPQASRDLPWRWYATPRWARDDHGEKVPYTRPANLAQRKLKAVQLMLAALAADDDPTGRLLVLDELGANLGSRHRELVLRGLAEAAQRTKVTILGTVQDDLQHDAFPFCEQVLVFCYPSHSRLLNEPVQMLARGPDGRLLPLAEALRGGRGIGWIPVLTEPLTGGTSTP
jgi:hypothetical protein